VTPINDEQRYDVLKGRHIGKYNNDPASGGLPVDPEDAGSWMLVLSSGSHGDLLPGDSLNVVFAVVCGCGRIRRKPTPLPGVPICG
jgi:hypothetical protein